MTVTPVEKAPALTARACAERAAEALDKATDVATKPGGDDSAAGRSQALVAVAHGWKELGAVISTYQDMQPERDEQPDRH